MPPDLRRLAAWLLAALLVAAPPAGAEDTEPPAEEPPTGTEAPDEPAPSTPEQAAAEEQAFRAKVDSAIDRGVAWILKRQLADGTWRVVPPGQPAPLGEHALAMLTLAKCGVPDKDPAMRRGLAALDRVFDAHVGGTGFPSAKTYDMAVTVLCHHAVHGRGQRDGKVRLPAAAEQRVRAIVAWLEKTQQTGVWRYPQPGSEDLSATQYALLALEMAARCGVPSKPHVYRRALDWLLRAQEATGPEVALVVENEAWTPASRYARWQRARKVAARGWAYQPGGTVTGSMTVAGLSSLAIVKAQLRQLGQLDAVREKAIDRALLDGLGWMGSRFSATGNPGLGASWHYYYLYGLERAGALLGQRNFGEHDWWREGAEVLLAAQEPEGAWPAVNKGEGSHDHPRTQTCFALLFLRRATTPPAVPVRPPATTGGDEADEGVR